jgi:hypothetical protein
MTAIPLHRRTDVKSRFLFRFLWLLPFAALQVGCANFKAVSAFANQTTGLTSTIRTEFSQLDKLCVDQAELVIVVDKIPDDEPLKDCDQYRASQGRLADITVTVLDNYARALGGLADDRSFDLSPEIQDVGSKIQGLRDRNGNALVNSKEIGAITKIVDLLVDIVTSVQREAAVRRMLRETPNLKILGDLLKSFFVTTADAPAGRARAPYVNLMAIASSSVNSTEASLRSPALSKAEPIRTAELLRQLQVRKQEIQMRTGDAPDRVPMQVAAAIDAWQRALDQFAADALKPDPQALFERLQELRDKSLAAKAAVEGLRN